MAYQEVLRVDISEVIRRWQAGISRRQVHRGGRGDWSLPRGVGAHRGAAKPPGCHQPAGSAAGEHSHRGEAGALCRPDLPVANGDRLYLTRVLELLAQRGNPVSYPSLHRFVARRNWRWREPGEVAEVDFGRMGLVHDPDTGRRRTVWALIVVLAYTRHSFVCPPSIQRLEDVIAGLEAGWAFFRGIPKYLVMDNFPVAVAGGGCPPPPAHSEIYRVFPAPRLHLRSGERARPQGQAEGGARRAVCA